MRQVILYPGEEGYWVIECSSLPGCISQGKTKEDPVKNIREAIEAMFSLSNKMVCLSRQSGLMQSCSPYERLALPQRIVAAFAVTFASKSLGSGG